MSFRLSSRGFLVNDPEYAPFGRSWLRGLTPARMGAVFAVCVASAFGLQDTAIALRGFTPEVAQSTARLAMRFFLAAFPMMVLVIKVDMWTARSSVRVRGVAFVLAVLAGAVAFPVVHVGTWTLMGYDWRRWPIYQNIPAFFYKALLLGSLLSAVLNFAARARDATYRLQRARLSGIAMEGQALESRLQLLRAQIEPHFLFNSLASVRRLYESQPEAGRTLLRNLAAVLRGAVDRGKRREAPLRDEVAMTRAYLEVFRLRMGGRIRLTIDVPPEIEGALLPPLILGTIVENAIKHGITPRAAGGSIAIRARREAEALVVEVSDDGIGFQGHAGTGLGLANSRARLASFYGSAGSLEVARNEAGGVTATIRLPLHTSFGTAAAAMSAMEISREGRAKAAHQGILARAWEIITWKHCAWATGIGIALAALNRFGRLASPMEFLGQVWLVETLWTVLFSNVFLAGIVLTEASSRDDNGPSGWRFACVASLAAAVCMGLAWTFPRDLPPRATNDPGQRMMQQLLRDSAPSFDRRRAQVTNFGSAAALHGLIATLVYVWLVNSRRAARKLAAAEIERAEASRSLVASQLEAAQAEIDPSFVFKALDRIEAAYDADRVAANAMLDELIGVLRAAIPKVRNESSPEGRHERQGSHS